MSSNIFHLVGNLWLFSSSKFKILALEDSSFCGEHEDCLLPQADIILFITAGACDLDQLQSDSL